MSFAFTYGISCANRAEMFQRIRDFLCKRNGTFDHSTDGIGWTLLDAVYAVDEDTLTDGDYFVAQSNGENSDFNFCIKFTYSTTHIKSRTLIYWNPTTHAGGTDPGETSDYQVFYVMDTDVPILSIGGDLDEIVIGYKRYAAITSAYIMYYGRPLAPEGRTSDILTATSTYTAGSDKSITFNESLPADWIVGNKIFLWSGLGDGYNVATIKTVNTGTKTITVDLSNALPSATVRGSRHFGFCGASSTSNVPAPYALLADNGAERSSLTAKCLFLASNVYDGAAPDTFDGFYWCAPIVFYGSYSFNGISKYLIGIATSPMTPVYGDTVTIEGAIYRVIYFSTGSMKYAMLETPV